MDEHLRSIAENANTHQPLAPGHERIMTEGFILWMGIRSEPAWNVVQRLRLPADTIDPAIEQVHAILAARGRTECSWEVGSSATPDGLVEELSRRGMVDDDDPDVIGMVLRAQPPPVAGVEARPIASSTSSARRTPWRSRRSARCRRPTRPASGHGTRRRSRPACTAHSWP